MALSDLLDKIESFDYSQVGKPQSFEANGSVVTGNQTFNRPLEEPLPIQEVIVGYGLRNSSQNFIEDTFANGFTAELSPDGTNGPGSTQFNFITNEISSYNPSLSFGDTTFQFGDSVNFFSNVRVKGFTQNTSPQNIGPGSTDFKFISGDTYTVKPEIKDTVYKWPSFNSPLEVNYFSDDFFVGFSKEINTTDTYPFTRPSLINATQLQGINDDGDKWNPNPKPFHLSDDYQIKIPVGPAHLVNFNGSTYQSNDTLPENNFEGQGEQQFRRQTARLKNFQSPSSFSPITARFASNFLVDDDPEVDPVLQTDIMQGSIQNLRVNTEGVTVNIGPGRGGIRYNQSYTGRQVQINGKTWKWGWSDMGFYDDKAPGIVPNELEDFAKEYMVDEGRIMMLDVDGDGKPIIGRKSGQILSDKKGGIEGLSNTYTDYVQAMSPGKSQPFIVRKIGDDWGLGGDNEGFFEAIGDFAGELLGGFIRTTGSPFDSFTGRLGREIADVVRKGKYLLTSDGLTFGIQQFLLQASNRTIESRIWNPLSLVSNNFVAFTRHMKGIDVLNDGGNYEEAIDGLGAIKSLLPDPISGLVDTLGLGKADEFLGKGRITNQVLWTRGDDLAIGGGEFKKIKIRLHNINHAFRFTRFMGQMDPYKGPDGTNDVGTDKDAESLIKKLEKGGERTDLSYTFLNDRENAPESFDTRGDQYKFKTYGQIPSSKDSRDDESLKIKPGHYEGDIRNPKPDKRNNIAIPKQIRNQKVFGSVASSSLAAIGGGSNVDIINQTNAASGYIPDRASNTVPRGENNRPITYLDPVNSRPLSKNDGGPTERLDYVLFKFNTLAYIKNTAQARTLQFRAILGGINETITPEYSEQRYLGRPDKYYTYNGVDRDISLEFTLYPKTAAEFPFLSEKLNYLVGLAYPQYTENNFMIAPFTEITIGDMFQKQPGYISSLNVTVQDNTTWELDLFQFPKHITANLTYRLIGKHLPHTFGKHYDIPWLQKNKEGHTLNLDEKSTLPTTLRYQGEGALGDLTKEMDAHHLSQEAGQ